jgi:integrase
MRTAGKLTDFRVRAAGAGTHGDGGGLYLAVKPGTAGLTRSWLFRYSIGGRGHWTGLGAYPDISLQRARQKAQECRQQLYDGVDPLKRKRDQRAALSQQSRTQAPTFAECAAAYIASHEAGWRGGRTRQMWVCTLRDYAYPVLGHLAVDEIATDHVLAVLKPLWRTKTETATHIRGRIEQVLAYAKALKHRSGENPARWRGHLDHLLPPRAKVAPVQHHPALPYRELPAFMDTLRRQENTAAKCLEFAILCACRSGEAIGAVWSEIDWESHTWIIPAVRTKAAREHRVPLSEPAIRLLRSLPRKNEYMFPGRYGGPQSHATLRTLLERMNVAAAVHGFRATFSTWARECTSFPRELVEAALGHVVGDVVERSYQRGDALERRRELMAAWGNYCTSTGAEVVQLRRASN